MLTLDQRTDRPNLQYQAFKCAIWEVSSWWLITKCPATARPLDELECDHGFFVTTVKVYIIGGDGTQKGAWAIHKVWYFSNPLSLPWLVKLIPVWYVRWCIGYLVPPSRIHNFCALCLLTFSCNQSQIASSYLSLVQVELSQSFEVKYFMPRVCWASFVRWWILLGPLSNCRSV